MNSTEQQSHSELVGEVACNVAVMLVMLLKMVGHNDDTTGQLDGKQEDNQGSS